MVAHAPLLGEVGTGRTSILTVAGVENWVIAVVLSGAGLLALRWFGATGNRWKHHCLATVAGQLVKTGLPAGMAVSTVTNLLAAVETTVEFVSTNL